MQTIICLGPKACDIGEAYEAKSDDYVIKLIDKEIEGDNCYSIARRTSPEEYEKHTPNLSKFFSDITDDVLFILSGECEVANCALKILQQIKDKNITIVYLMPQFDFLNNRQFTQERVIRNVLQEYVRSGLLNNIVLLDNVNVENIMGQTSIKDFDAQFSATIFTLLSTYVTTKTNEPVIDKSNAPKEVSRIMTFGYYDIVSDNEKLLYNIDLIDDKIYNFYLTEETLNGDAKLLRQIKDKLKNKAVDNTKISYTIHSTTAETDFCFVVAYSKIVQR